MGQIVGAAVVSHHPGLMQCEEFRVLQGAGADSDLIAGYGRLRDKIAAARPDVAIIFDTHWFTTGYHLVDAGAAYRGLYTSEEMPWYLHGVPYAYRGHPALAYAIEAAARERGVPTRAIDHPDLSRHYPTINLLKQLRLEGLPVVSMSSCQNCEPRHYLQSGEAIGEAIRRGGLRVLLLASGALSHRFNNIDWKPKHPRIFHESNVSRPENVVSDKRAIALMTEGRHDAILDRWDEDYRRLPWEAFGAHYLQMVGAMGGRDCRATGEVLSAYENARGTGNIHIWFGG
ncbi:MAG: extradiol ring-cleavage dioxygenase [Burkholderiales bacterium]|nr:extradiol ring-cleavage dioxygenase [Burkholderiales bacterium]